MQKMKNVNMLLYVLAILYCNFFIKRIKVFTLIMFFINEPKNNV